MIAACPDGSIPCPIVTVHHPLILVQAMHALHELLADIEIEVANTEHAARMCPSRRQRRGLENLIDHWEAQLTRLRSFFDWDVYFDRPATNNKLGVSS